VHSASGADASWPSRSEYKAETFQRRTGSFLSSRVLARATVGRISNPSRKGSFMNVFHFNLLGSSLPPLAQRSVSLRRLSNAPGLLWALPHGDY